MAGLSGKQPCIFRAFFKQRHDDLCSVNTTCLDLLKFLGVASFNDAVLLLIIEILIKETGAGIWMHTYFNECLNRKHAKNIVST